MTEMKLRADERLKDAKQLNAAITGQYSYQFIYTITSDETLVTFSFCNIPYETVRSAIKDYYSENMYLHKT